MEKKSKQEQNRMKIKPLSDRILVKNDAAETKTASGLYIPEGAR